MKIPYKEELITLSLIFSLILIGIATYELIMTPDPMTNYVIPSFLWELGFAMTLVTATWPTSLTIWVLCVLYLINRVNSQSKKETKTEIMKRLREVNSCLNQELIHANARLADKVSKLVHLEALLKSKRCPNCLELLEE